LVAGEAYGLVQARSPALPMIALVGLFGMGLGSQAVDMAKRRFVPPAQTSIQRSLEQYTISTIDLKSLQPFPSPRECQLISCELYKLQFNRPLISRCLVFRLRIQFDRRDRERFCHPHRQPG
jgi:XapX domain-containing protein